MTRVARVVPFALGAALVVGLVILVAGLVGGGDEKYVVRAEFKDSAGLRKNSDVKIGGVPGGKIKAIDLTRGDTALVTMELEKGLTIGQGAKAQARPVNLLGEKYVDLDPGDLARPASSGATVPLNRTGAAIELDDILNMLSPDTRAGLRILINEAGIAMAGRGADFNAMLDELPPALDQSRRVVAEFASQNATLRDLINEGDRVLATMAPRKGDLQDFVTQAERALVATSDRRAELGATVQEAPGAIGQLRRTLAELRSTASALIPASHDLRRAAGPLAATLRRLPAFAHDARGTLAAAERVSPALKRLGAQGSPIIRRLRPAAQQLASFSSDLAPLTATFDEGRAFDGLLGLMAGWRRTIQTSDGLGHVFRLHTIIDDDFLDSAGNRFAAMMKQPASSRRVSLRPNRHGTTHVPTLTTPHVLRDAPGTVKRVLKGAGNTVKNAGSEVGRLLNPNAQPQPQPQPRSDTSRLLDYLMGP